MNQQNFKENLNLLRSFIASKWDVEIPPYLSLQFKDDGEIICNFRLENPVTLDSKLLDFLSGKSIMDEEDVSLYLKIQRLEEQIEKNEWTIQNREKDWSTRHLTDRMFESACVYPEEIILKEIKKLKKMNKSLKKYINSMSAVLEVRLVSRDQNQSRLYL
jgi:hypothetical protein